MFSPSGSVPTIPSVPSIRDDAVFVPPTRHGKSKAVCLSMAQPIQTESAPVREFSKAMATPFLPQSLYKQILESIPIACVDIAVMSQGKVLLVQRKDAPA